MTLVVIAPFGAYARGARITDAAEIKAVLAGEAAAYVRKVAGETKPAAPQSAAAKPETPAA